MIEWDEYADIPVVFLDKQSVIRGYTQELSDIVARMASSQDTPADIRRAAYLLIRLRNP